MKTDYLRLLYNLSDHCAQFKREIVRHFFTLINGQTIDFQSNELYCFTPQYRDFLEPIVRSVEICDLLGIAALEVHKPRLMEFAHKLGDPESVRKRQNFESYVTQIADTFSKVRSTLIESVNSLNGNEIDRLNEAIHCFLEGCYFSTVAMSVTAIEFRILEWMKRITPDGSSKLEELTLGQLVGRILQDEEYRERLPKKYHPLLGLCNEYRVFSVHAKSEMINKRVASSILNLSMEFLFDKSLMTKSAP
jgi:hypothetical protein